MKYPADDGESQDNTIFGIDISASDLGNVNYGVVGAALDIPDNMLFWQAGAAQLRDHNGYGLLDSMVEAWEIGAGEEYGDQQDDFANIKQGIELYKDGYFRGGD